MIRLFTTHHIRPQQELSESLWTLTPLEGPLAGQPRSVLVPGCWENLPGLEAYRGTARYTRPVTGGGNLRFAFEGVSHTATVFLDGQQIAHHYNAYTPFEAVVPGVPQGTHTLEVLVDNRFGPDSALHIPNDYMTYGGITRPVALETLPDTYLDWVHAAPRRTDTGWICNLEVCLTQLAPLPGTVTVTAELAGERLTWTLDQAAAGQIRLTGTIAPQNIEPWCPEHPVLYPVTVQLCCCGVPVDDLIDRMGFREIRVEGRHILLNGTPLRIRGFCRHEDMAGFGCAVPVQAMQRDLALLRDLGANAVRTTHYPNDPRFLDLCDEQGILVWEENHARGLVEADMRNPNFEPQCEACNAEMVTAHYNHPSIYIWGILNECASETAYGRECYAAQLAQLRALDASRPLTFATCRFSHKPDGSELKLNDICLDLPDVVSANMYPCWYFDTDVPDFLARMHACVEATPGAGKPFLVSEIGAGAIYGCHDDGGAKWSEEYQAEALRAQLTAVLADPDCVGVYIWQFCDVPVSREWFANRPRSHNNKGVVDEFRRRKLAYKVVQEIFRNDATLS